MNTVRALFFGLLLGLAMEAVLWIGIESNRHHYRLGLDAGQGLSTAEAVQASFRHGYRCGFQDGQPKKVELVIEEEK